MRDGSVTADEVRMVYGIFLEREPEIAGLEYWCRHASSIVELVDHVIRSPEFQQRACEAAAAEARRKMREINAQMWVMSIAAKGAGVKPNGAWRFELGAVTG